MLTQGLMFTKNHLTLQFIPQQYNCIGHFVKSTSDSHNSISEVLECLTVKFHALKYTHMRLCMINSFTFFHSKWLCRGNCIPFHQHLLHQHCGPTAMSHNQLHHYQQPALVQKAISETTHKRVIQIFLKSISTWLSSKDRRSGDNLIVSRKQSTTDACPSWQARRNKSRKRSLTK